MTGAEVREQARTVYASFSGTDRQRNAGYILRAHAQNHAMDECMEDAGYPAWDWSLTRIYASPVDPLGPGIWFREPNRPFRSQLLMSQRPRILAEAEMNQDGIPADEDAAIGACIVSVPAPSESDAEAASHPISAVALMREWEDTIGQQAASVDSTTEYFSCMDAAPIPALDQHGLPAEDLGQAMSALGPKDGDVPVSPVSPQAQGTGWQEFLAAEKTITDADWACRKNVYERHINTLGPVISQFASSHHEEILKAQREWADVEREAAALGYTGQVGPLGG